MKLRIKKISDNCFTVVRTIGQTERKFTISQSIDVKNDGALIFFTDKNGRNLKELPATHYANITIGTKTYPTPEACIEVLAEIINFKLGGGATPPVPPPATNGWQPHPDWWDIKKIFEDDTDPNKRFIMLITDSNNDITLAQAALGNATVYYKTSDGAAYNASTQTHTWDKMQDKQCADGYKTRYVIVYSTDENVNCYLGSFNTKHIFFGNESIINTLIQASASWMENNKMIEAIEMDETVTAIEAPYSFWFSTCHSLKSTTIPAGIKNIESECFRQCYALTSITIPNGVLTIRMMAFDNCTSLTFINIPKSVTNIELNAFNNCYSLLSFNIEDDWIAPQGINLTQSTNLSISGIIDFFTKLGATGTPVTITLGATNLAKLTSTEITIATNKGYTLA